MTHDCAAECVAGWSAGRKCHCTSCGNNFSVITHFDKHRDKKTGRCIPPESVGLVENDRGTWLGKGETDFYDRLKAEGKT